MWSSLGQNAVAVNVPLKDQNRLVQVFLSREGRGPIAPVLVALWAIDPPQPDLDSNPFPPLDRDGIAVVDRDDPAFPRLPSQGQVSSCKRG